MFAGKTLGHNSEEASQARCAETCRSVSRETPKGKWDSLQQAGQVTSGHSCDRCDFRSVKNYYSPMTNGAIVVEASS